MKKSTIRFLTRLDLKTKDAQNGITLGVKRIEDFPLSAIQDNWKSKNSPGALEISSSSPEEFISDKEILREIQKLLEEILDSISAKNIVLRLNRERKTHHTPETLREAFSSREQVSWLLKIRFDKVGKQISPVAAKIIATIQ